MAFGLILKVTTVSVAFLSSYIYFKVPQKVIKIHVELIKGALVERFGKRTIPLISTSGSGSDSDTSSSVLEVDLTTTETEPPPSSSSPPPFYELTVHQLKSYTGHDTSKPILISLGSLIFDVSSSPQFYGPNGHYSIFAGCACTRALSIGSMEEEDRNDDLNGVPEEDWKGQVEFYRGKYGVVGRLVEG